MRLQLIVILIFSCMTQVYSQQDIVTKQDKRCIGISEKKGSSIKSYRLTNSCSETLDIEIYKQGNKDFWLSEYRPGIKPGETIDVELFSSATGKICIYTRRTGSKERFYSRPEFEKLFKEGKIN